MRSAGRSPGTADPSKKIGVREPASAVTAARMPAKKNNAFRQDAPDAADPSKSRPRGTSCRKACGEYHTGEALATPGKKKSNFARPRLSNFAHSKSLTLRVGQQLMITPLQKGAHFGKILTQFFEQEKKK